ncbi:MAG: hypothetical protein JO048_18475 [Methylobacteriaceae bacterium]|nr:hypothetical protein [Methylobacteriaceae bacterium]
MLTTEDLLRLLPGRTLHHELAPGSPQGEGLALFHFGADGRAVARLPGGRLISGAYRIQDDAYVLDWDGGLQNSRSTLTPDESGRYICRNAETGAVRSTVVDVVDGDPAGLSSARSTSL